MGRGTWPRARQEEGEGPASTPRVPGLSQVMGIGLESADVGDLSPERGGAGSGRHPENPHRQLIPVGEGNNREGQSRETAGGP